MTVHLTDNPTQTSTHPDPTTWAAQASHTAAAARQLLAGYQPISLSEMEAVSLLRRVDTKFLLSSRQLWQALAVLPKHYRVLQIEARRLHRYHNLYFDSPDFLLYHQHQRGQRQRYKLRTRQYADTQQVYLEVKRKNNRDQTIKSRLPGQRFYEQISAMPSDFLAAHLPYPASDWQPVLWNDFMRLTLVSTRTIERLTLDLNLAFSNGWQQIGLPSLVVAEVKQEKFSIHSAFMRQMRAMKVQPQRFSKYCQGVLLFYPQAKANRFKRRSLLVERLMRQEGRHESHA